MTSQPTEHGGMWTPAHAAQPHLNARHDHYDPPCWSIELTHDLAAHNVYVTGTPADLHAFALRVIAAADQAATAEDAAVKSISQAETDAILGAALVEVLADRNADEHDRWTTGDEAGMDLI